ncbi:MAG: hypothetical protein VX519_02615 [Myxococcota bacterium]|nr:hypothetical protein [Myxococcota bacterium]
MTEMFRGRWLLVLSCVLSAAGCQGDNHRPSSPGVEIQPIHPQVGEADLDCVITEESVDPDGDSLSYQYSWKVDGEPVESVSQSIDSGVPKAGERWACSVVAFDGEKSSKPGEAEVVVVSEFQGWDTDDVSLAAADWIFKGMELDDQLGRNTRSAGDIDGDGLSDLLLTAHGESTTGFYAGAAYVVLSASLGEPGVRDVDEADYVFLGEASEDLAGHGSSTAGDLDQDGHDDLYVSGYLHDGDTFDVGRIYVIHGGTLGTAGAASLLDVAGHVIGGEAENDHLGHEVFTAGDVDGDGIADMVTGAYNAEGEAYSSGKAYFFSGARLAGSGWSSIADADHHFLGTNTRDEAGITVNGAGDVDGDGLDDLLIGAKGYTSAEGESGAVYLVLAESLGDSNQLLSEATSVFVGEGSGDRCCVVSGVGDVNGDGVPDLGFGAQYSSEADEKAGQAYVVSGARARDWGVESLSEADWQFTGEAFLDGAGCSVAGAGDIDADGVDDLLVGAAEYGNSPQARTRGRGYLVLGSSLGEPGQGSLSTADYRFTGEDVNHYAGWDFQSAGDVDGDGRPDLLLGAPVQPDFAYYVGPGRAYLLLTR